MEKFETVLSKHGETGIQAILENWEHYTGTRHSVTISLEQRWDHFMNQTETSITRQAA